VKLLDIIKEIINFNTYEGMVQVIYDESEGSTKVAELIRALPGVTTVTLASDEGRGRETLKVKLISQKSPKEAFDSMKKNAISKYTPIRVVNIAYKTITKK